MRKSLQTLMRKDSDIKSKDDDSSENKKNESELETKEGFNH